jgi:hypothetical protein
MHPWLIHGCTYSWIIHEFVKNPLNILGFLVQSRNIWYKKINGLSKISRDIVSNDYPWIRTNIGYLTLTSYNVLTNGFRPLCIFNFESNITMIFILMKRHLFYGPLLGGCYLGFESPTLNWNALEVQYCQ